MYEYYQHQMETKHLDSIKTQDRKEAGGKEGHRCLPIGSGEQEGNSGSIDL